MRQSPGERTSRGPSDPSPWVVRFAALVPPGGAVLDLAGGAGRHTRLFLGRGHPVLAVDADVGGLADLEGSPGLEILEADLESGAPLPWGGRRFDGVVVTNYLHRPILPAVVEAVAPGGALLYETFARGHAEIRGRPFNSDFLLLPGELLEAVRGRLRVVAYEDVVTGPPAPAAIQRIAAVRDDGGVESSGGGRDEALRVLAQGWEELREGLEAAGRAGLLGAHAAGEEWSPVDLAGHIAAWERLALEVIEDRRAGSALRLETVLEGSDAVDRFNAQTIEANRARPVADVLEEADRTRRDLSAAIAGLTDDEWSAVVRSTTRKPVPLGDALGGLVGAPHKPFGHVSAHRDDLERFKRSAPASG